MVRTYTVGDWIGDRFQVFDIHEGGMSLVYVVNDQMGGTGPQVVALKTLRHELLRSPIRISRFAAECRLWAQLGEHPHIVRAHAVEIIDGRPYVVLELIQGGELSRWIGTPRLDLMQALRFGYQFCLGLEHALHQGLHCHRDIKPGNLLVTEEGILKITDFGLARVSEEMVASYDDLADGSIPLSETAATQPIIWTDPRDEIPAPLSPVDRETIDYVPADETVNSRLTRSGVRLGTGPYMAPEQFQDPRSVDVRADLYAFGIVLFEMITGGLPFKGRSMDALRRQHSRQQPPSIIPSVPHRHIKVAKRLDQIVQRCLMKEPTDRYGSVAELRHALNQLRTQLRHDR